MSRRIRLVPALLFVLLAGMRAAALADSLLLRSGTLVEGHLPTPTFTLQTSSGQLEIPRSSIRAITFSASTVEITLRDNTTVIGTLALETVELQQPMMLRRVPVADVREILFSEEANAGAAPPRERAAPAGDATERSLPAGSPIALELARTLSSAGRARAGEAVPLCVAADVMLGGRVVIPAGRVAVGELAVVDPAGAGNREGRLVLEVKRTWSANGVEVPLQGQVAFEGRFNASNVAAMGAMGLLAQGGQATALAGAPVAATLARAIALEDTLPSGAQPGTPTPWPQELQERCDLYRRFRNPTDPMGWLRVNDVPKDLDLAPMKSPDFI